MSVVVVLLTTYLVAAALAWVLAERVIFQPQPVSYADGPEIRKVPVAGGDFVAARWLPNPGARYAILFSHGNAEDIGDLEPYLERLRDAGFSVLAYDYRGYGRSTAIRPTERRSYADEAAAYRYLTRDLGIPPARVILHGRSLGGGVASELAARCPVAGLVLESTFTSAFRVLTPPVFPFDRFTTARRLARIGAPTLVIHGTRDAVIPVEHGRRLHAALRSPVEPLWVAGAGHDDVALVAGKRYFSALRRFAAGLPDPVAPAEGSCPAG